MNPLTRRLIAAWIAASYFPIMLNLYQEGISPGLFLFFPYTLMYSAGVTFTYGMIISIVMDYLIKSRLLRFFAYLFCGSVPLLFVKNTDPLIILAGAVIATLFFIINEWLKKEQTQRSKVILQVLSWIPLLMLVWGLIYQFFIH